MRDPGFKPRVQPRGTLTDHERSIAWGRRPSEAVAGDRRRRSAGGTDDLQLTLDIVVARPEFREMPMDRDFRVGLVVATLTSAFLAMSGQAMACDDGWVDFTCGDVPNIPPPVLSEPPPPPPQPTYVGKCNDTCVGNGSKGTTCNVYDVYRDANGNYFKVWLGHNKDRYNPLCSTYGL